MTRLIISLATAAALAGGLAALPTPAAAQAGQLQVDVFGNDPCPTGYICIRHRESDRYRLPKSQQLQGTRQQQQSWANKSQALTTVGATGTGSCSAVGPGGREGCLVKEIQQAKKETKEQQQSDTPPEL
jgi:type II secretory pathway pseudopilin PulG